MQCPTCGHQNRPDARFCDRCGTSLSPGPAMPSATPITPVAQIGPHGGMVGVARNIQIRSEEKFTMWSNTGKKTIQVLSFRVELFDRSGNRFKTVQVEMRGRTIIGSINDGDQLEFFSQQENGMLVTNYVENLTTGAAVSTRG